MKVLRDADVDEHDVQVGSVVRTDHISLSFLERAAVLYGVEYAQGPNDQSGPDFLQPEYAGEPLFPLQHDVKGGKKEEEGKDGIDKEKGTQILVEPFFTDDKFVCEYLKAELNDEQRIDVIKFVFDKWQKNKKTQVFRLWYKTYKVDNRTKQIY